MFSMPNFSVLILSLFLMDIYIKKVLDEIDCIDSVTYNGYGTFTYSDFFDLQRRPLVLLPDSPKDINPTFSLYTRKFRYRPETLLITKNLRYYSKTKFNPKLETKIIVYGYIDNSYLALWTQSMMDNFLAIKDYNIIIVDWMNGNLFPYVQATANARIVGPMIGKLIENLCKTFNISEESFHIIGHSLGSHIAGYAGKYLEGKVGHITGLDPAGPFFQGLNDPRVRLWYTDAKFVDVIHTNAQSISFLFELGMYETCGHVDIYPNGGRTQPGCNTERITAFIDQGIYQGHQRAIDFYIESILDAGATPVAYQCKDYDSFEDGKCFECGIDGSKCTTLGPSSYEYKKYLETPIYSPGKRFFLKTRGHRNFFQFQFVVRIKMSKKSSTEEATVTLKFLDYYGLGKPIIFNEKAQLFESDKTYSRVILSEIEASHLDNIMFKWSGGFFDIFSSKLIVDHIVVIPLSTENDLPVNMKEMIFKSEIAEIESGSETTFRSSDTFF